MLCYFSFVRNSGVKFPAISAPRFVEGYIKLLQKKLKILGIGTNVGDKLANLRQALAMLPAEGIFIRRVSAVYATPPWGDENQDDFLNIVVAVAFEGSPNELLEKILQIEKDMGRIRLRKWGPRLIDIDIIEFDGIIMDEQDLQLPHPFYTRRIFVVAPFAELYPEWIPTGGDKTLGELMEAMKEEEFTQLPDRIC